MNDFWANFNKTVAIDISNDFYNIKIDRDFMKTLYLWHIT
jgi:hypothetical protein